MNCNPFLPWALWVSEIWYGVWASDPCKYTPNYRLRCKARGIVIYDRVLNGEFDPRKMIDA